jgi:hypothetical protein
VSLEKAAIAFAVLVVLVIAAFALARRASRRTRTQSLASVRAPASLHFVCAGCSERYSHTKRTVSAFERGTTRLFCNACHGKWVAGRPRQQQSVASRERLSGGSNAHTRHVSPAPRARARSGCLGTAVLLVALPVVLVVYAAVT